MICDQPDLGHPSVHIASDSQERGFIDWFVQNGGKVDVDNIGIHDFSEIGMGRGMIALRDIPEGTTVFELPRSLVLATRTSSLSKLLPEGQWRKLVKEGGWSALILVMMWEEERARRISSGEGDIAGADGKDWGPYFEIMPKSFDTPMFWSEAHLHELKGCTVQGKIGKAEADVNYKEQVLPIITSNPSVFPAAHQTTSDPAASAWSVETYHRMGSLILSRSFTVEDPEPDEEGSEGDADGMDVDTSMDERNRSVEMRDVHDVGDGVGADGAGDRQDTENAGDVSDGEEDEEDENDVENVGMVPMADILNAKSGCNNARLFYEKDLLRMISTKHIKAGEQIFNTYASPPNSDLLRRYGHVDDDDEGWANDEVELGMDLAAAIVVPSRGDGKAKGKCKATEDVEDLRKEKIEWALENGVDDIFTIYRSPRKDDEEDEHSISSRVPGATTSIEPPAELISAIRLFALSRDDFDQMVKKGNAKAIKPKMDENVADWAKKVLRRRLEDYPTSIEEDENLLRQPAESFSSNRRNAIVVRLGEKKVLRDCLQTLEEKWPTVSVKVKEKVALDTAGGASKVMSRKDLREEKKRLKEEREDEETDERKKKKRRKD